MVTVSPTPVGSLHDRACDIFYELKGGITDYGEEHSKKHGHSVDSDTCTRNRCSKSGVRERPIHIVGHSFGGQTARMLLHLLSSGFFLESHGADASWIKSVTTISSPLNGSMAVYALGAKRRQGKRRTFVCRSLLTGILFGRFHTPVRFHVPICVEEISIGFRYGSLHETLHFKNSWIRYS